MAGQYGRGRRRVSRTPMLRWLPALASTLLVATSLHSQPAAAIPLPSADRPVAYTVVEQDLREVLAEVGRQFGLRVSISEAVHGRVHGRLPPAPLAGFLDRLADIHGFDWYFDGGTLHVSGTGEATSKVLTLGPVGFGQLTRTLAALGIADPRWPLRGSPDARIAFADGPPRYLQLVEQALAALMPRGDAVSSVRVFRGAANSLVR